MRLSRGTFLVCIASVLHAQISAAIDFISYSTLFIPELPSGMAERAALLSSRRRGLSQSRVLLTPLCADSAVCEDELPSFSDFYRSSRFSLPNISLPQVHLSVSAVLTTSVAGRQR